MRTVAHVDGDNFYHGWLMHTLDSSGEDNLFDRQKERCLAAGSSLSDSVSVTIRAYVDGTPKFRGKQKQSRNTRQSLLVELRRQELDRRSMGI